MLHAPSSFSRTLAPALLYVLCGCRPELTAGEWVCAEEGASTKKADMSDPVKVPWETGFEDRFCDYTELAGFCYQYGDASYDLVTSPVHSGNYAAAFRVNADDENEHHARCVRQGALPQSAYYGAWYFVPESAATNGKTWNLLHFQGAADARERLDDQWDVSLVNGSGQDLELMVFDQMTRTKYFADDPKPIPIGAWFHIEFYLKRAMDETGEIALYQDGALLLEAADLVTDASPFAQWYVGNYSRGLVPSNSTLYVDDVSIRARP